MNLIWSSSKYLNWSAICQNSSLWITWSKGWAPVYCYPELYRAHKAQIKISSLRWSEKKSSSSCRYLNLSFDLMLTSARCAKSSQRSNVILRSSSGIGINLICSFFSAQANIWTDLGTWAQLWSAIQLCSATFILSPFVVHGRLF